MITRKTKGRYVRFEIGGADVKKLASIGLYFMREWRLRDPHVKGGSGVLHGAGTAGLYSVNLLAGGVYFRVEFNFTPLIM
jgi:hypothetical protein